VTDERPTTVGVMFVDGSIITAPTFRDVERIIRTNPWNADFKSKEDFREEMARRAWVWSWTYISDDVETSSKKFIASLEEAGMLRVLRMDEWEA
jgi:hypothetical protein